MQVQKVIELLGYSPKEAKVYLTVLALGESHVSDIAEKTKLPRTSAQVILEKLLEDQLVNFYVMRRYKYWTAENPERILSNLVRRESLIREAIPKLLSLQKENKSKRYKNNVKQSLSLFKLLADTANVPVLITDQKAKILYVNDRWEDQFGYTLEEVVGETPKILQSGKTPRDVYENMWRSLEENRLFQSDRIIDKKKDGSLFNLMTTIFPVHHHKQTFYIQILTDVSQKKHLESLKTTFSYIAN